MSIKVEYICDMPACRQLREEVARLTKALQTIQKLYEVAPDEMAYSIAQAALTQGKGGVNE